MATPTMGNPPRGVEQGLDTVQVECSRALGEQGQTSTPTPTKRLLLKASDTDGANFVIHGINPDASTQDQECSENKEPPRYRSRSPALRLQTAEHDLQYVNTFGGFEEWTNQGRDTKWVVYRALVWANVGGTYQYTQTCFYLGWDIGTKTLPTAVRMKECVEPSHALANETTVWYRTAREGKFELQSACGRHTLKYATSKLSLAPGTATQGGDGRVEEDGAPTAFFEAVSLPE